MISDQIKLTYITLRFLPLCGLCLVWTWADWDDSWLCQCRELWIVNVRSVDATWNGATPLTWSASPFLCLFCSFLRLCRWILNIASCPSCQIQNTPIYFGFFFFPYGMLCFWSRLLCYKLNLTFSLRHHLVLVWMCLSNWPSCWPVYHCPVTLWLTGLQCMVVALRWCGPVS